MLAGDLPEDKSIYMISHLLQPTERGDGWLTEREDVIPITNKMDTFVECRVFQERKARAF